MASGVGAQPGLEDQARGMGVDVLPPDAAGASARPARLAQVNAQWVVTAEGYAWNLLPRIDEASAHPLFAGLVAAAVERHAGSAWVAEA